MGDMPGDFRLLGQWDHSALASYVENLPPEVWLEEGGERAIEFEVHSHTDTIPLLFDEDYRHKSPTVRPRYEEFEPLWQAVREIVQQCYPGDGYFIRVILTRLADAAQIPAHRDSSYSLVTAHRIHVPLVSNSEVRFSVGDEQRHLAPGEIWEINNSRIHSVANPSNHQRIHLIVDWVIKGEERFFQKGYDVQVEAFPECEVLIDQMSVQGRDRVVPMPRKATMAVAQWAIQTGAFSSGQLAERFPKMSHQDLSMILMRLSNQGIIQHRFIERRSNS